MASAGFDFETKADPAVEVEDLDCRLGGLDVLRGVNLRVNAGLFVGILGPNGSGKTTLLRCIAGLQKASHGLVRVFGHDVAAMRPAVLARQLALQGQDRITELHFTVRDVVEMGRLVHRGGIFGRSNGADDLVVTRWLCAFDLLPLAAQSFANLSGGERQRVMMARALAQEPQILLLDEPTNHLDVRHRFEALQQVRALGITVVATLHELEAAGRLCDRLILLHRGSVVADGEPADVLTPDNIERVYDVDASVDRHPTTRQIRIDLQPRRPACSP